jgi:hypothetical protein
MAKDTKASDEISSVAKEGMERVREGMESYFNFLKQVISAYPSGGTEFGEKLKRHAEQNVTAVQEYVTKLSTKRRPSKTRFEFKRNSCRLSSTRSASKQKSLLRLFLKQRRM